MALRVRAAKSGARFLGWTGRAHDRCAAAVDVGQVCRERGHRDVALRLLLLLLSSPASALLGHSAELSLRARHQQHRGAGAAVYVGHLLADPLRRSGDDDALACELLEASR